MTKAPEPTLRLKGATALITGATRGIGRAVALAYAREGAHVIALARTRGALEELDDEIRAAGGSASLIPLNLAHGPKVDALGPNLIERFPHLDVLVANAGILGPLSPIGHIADKQWDEVLNINLMANMRLIRSLDPLLRRATAGRAIFVSSGAAINCRAYWGPYSVSKAGLEALVKCWASELASTNARANLLDPGATRTAMRAKAMPGEDPSTLPAPEALVEIFVQMALPAYTENGARVVARDHAAFAG